VKRQKGKTPRCLFCKKALPKESSKEFCNEHCAEEYYLNMVEQEGRAAVQINEEFDEETFTLNVTEVF